MPSQAVEEALRRARMGVQEKGHELVISLEQAKGFINDIAGDVEYMSAALSRVRKLRDEWLAAEPESGRAWFGNALDDAIGD